MTLSHMLAFLLGTEEFQKSQRYRKEVQTIGIMLLLLSSWKKIGCVFDIITFQKVGKLLSISSPIANGSSDLVKREC